MSFALNELLLQWSLPVFWVCTGVRARSHLLSGFLCYVNILEGGLVLDDVIAIQLNPDVTEDVGVLSLFTHDFWLVRGM